MKIRILARIGLAAILALCSLNACSSSETGKTQAAVAQRVMPTDYSHLAVDTYSELSAYFPEQTTVAAFASYGSIVDTLKAVEKWDIISQKSLDSAISDLDLHYRIHPMKLKSFYDAGFHTGKGFGIGVIQGNLVFVMSVLDQDKVLGWFENFTNEEYGRPVVETRSEKDWKVTEMRVMDADYATVAQKGEVAVIALGSKFGSAKSSETAAVMMAAEKANKNFKTLTQARGLDKKFAQSAIGAVALADGWMPPSVPESAKTLVKSYLSDFNAGVVLSDAEASIHVSAGMNANNEYIKLVDEIGIGNKSPWTTPILNSTKGPKGCIQFNPLKLENLLMAVLPSSTSKKWDGLKDKLTQKFLGINFYDQVFSNLSGSVWISLGSAALNPGEQLTLSNALKMDAVVYLPVENAELAGKFFGKVSFLKSFIPADKATLETIDGGILHAVIKLTNSPLHASYADGLIALATDSSWPRVLKLYQAPDQNQAHLPANTSELFGSKQLAVQLDGRDVVSILNTACADKCAKITKHLSKFGTIQVQINEANAGVDVDVKAKAPQARATPAES